MNTKEFIFNVFSGEFGVLDSFNKSLEYTGSNRIKIKMLIEEIDVFFSAGKLLTTSHLSPLHKSIHDDIWFSASFQNNLSIYDGFPSQNFDRLEQLKSSLLDFTDSQSEVLIIEKPQTKGVWGLAARFNFIKELGVLELFTNMTNETAKAKAISQILGCSVDNAKKLKNGHYQSKESIDEQLERKQLFEQIKQHQVDKKG